MSRPSKKRKKFARKPTPRCATLETIREDEDLVATASLSSILQGIDAIAIASKAFRKTSKRGRRRKAKVKGEPTTRAAVQPRTEASDALEAVWNEIEELTKKNLTVQLRQLVEFVDQGREDIRLAELVPIQLNLSPDVHGMTVAVSGFLTILRDGPIETLREMNARAEDMWNTRDELMADESESDDGDSDSSSSNGDAPMPNASDASSSDSEASSKMSTESDSSNETMEDM